MPLNSLVLSGFILPQPQPTSIHSAHCHLSASWTVASNILPLHNKPFRSPPLLSGRIHNSKFDHHTPQFKPNCLLKLVNVLTLNTKFPLQLDCSPHCSVIKPQAFMGPALCMCSFYSFLFYSSFIKSYSFWRGLLSPTPQRNISWTISVHNNLSHLQTIKILPVCDTQTLFPYISYPFTCVCLVFLS